MKKRSIFISALAFALILTFVYRSDCLAQSAPAQPPGPDKRIIPSQWHDPYVNQALVGGFWRTDHGFRPTLRIFNAVQTAPLIVIPVLYMADGTKYSLTKVDLQASGVAVIDIRDALQSAQKGVSEHISEYGSAGVEYFWPWGSAVKATIENIDAARSLIHNYSLAPSSDTLEEGSSETKDRWNAEGLWWKRSREDDVFLALSNTTAKDVTCEVVVDSDDGARHRRLRTEPRQTLRVDLAELLPRHESAVTEGGISLSCAGPLRSVMPMGGVENAANGFSASMTFTYHFGEDKTPVQHRFVSAGIMVGKPDQMMNFPEKTRFIPYAVFRNPSPHSVKVTVAGVLRGDGQQSVPLGGFELEPNRTTRFNVLAALKAAGIPKVDGDLTLLFDTNSHVGDLLISSGSIDETGTYVFQVVPRLAGSSMGREICFWSYDGQGTDTMIALWNEGSTTQNVVVTFHSSEGDYRTPVSIPAQSSITVDVGELVMSNQPDLNGKTFPAAAQFGSATVEDSEASTNRINIVASPSTFNVRTATCGDVCDNCNGYTGYWTQDSGFGLIVQGTYQAQAVAHTQNGYYDYWTSSSSWSSDAPSVGTVNAGLVSGISGGGLNLNAFKSLPPSRQLCYDVYLSCDAVPFQAPPLPGTVRVPFRENRVTPDPFNRANTCSPGFAGRDREITGIIVDQYNSPFTTNGVTMTEFLNVGRNDLGLPPPTTGSTKTANGGQFLDEFFFCSSHCPGGAGETDAVQTLQYGGVPVSSTNSLTMQCTQILWNNQ